MGYSRTTESCQGYYDRGAMFNTIGIEEDGVSIQDLVPMPGATAVSEMEDLGAYIYEIDDFGTPISTFAYAIEGSTSVPGGKAGWYALDAGKYTYADKKFIRGEGFLFSSPWFEDGEGEDAGSYLQSAGEVKLEATSLVQPCQGYYIYANYRPVELDIQKIVPGAGATAVSDMEDLGAYIYEIDDFGTPVSTFAYAIEGSASVPGGKAGWYALDAGKYTYADKKFAAGNGFLYSSPWFEDGEGEDAGSVLTFNE